MARYKKDSNKRLKQQTSYHIPWSNEEGDTSHNVTVVQFPKDADHGFVKRELRQVFMQLGCNRSEAKRATIQMFPELK